MGSFGSEASELGEISFLICVAFDDLFQSVDFISEHVVNAEKLGDFLFFLLKLFHGEGAGFPQGAVEFVFPLRGF